MSEPQSTNSLPNFGAMELPDIDAICDQHGPYKAKQFRLSMADKPVVGKCPRCSADRAAQAEAKRIRNDADQRDARVRQLLHSAGIPLRFADRSFANYATETHGQKMALNVCKRYAETWKDQRGKGGSLVLTGGPGTGKTHLACAVANAIIPEHMASVSFGTVASMLRHIKATYRKDSERDEEDAIADLCEPDLLILDEIGVQTGSEHEKMLVFEVLNERYQQMLPTILLSNLSGDDLEQFLGHRIMDRYRECGVILAFDWPSHRAKS